MYTIIMAGGSGTRLWPKSRENSPKQLHALVGEKTLIQDTVRRIEPLIEHKDIFVITSKKYVHKIKAQIPGIPRDNIIAEPNPLGTAAAIALGAAKVAKIDPNAAMVVLWSDCNIENEEEFIKALQTAEKAVAHTDGVIIGVNPTFPSTGYGYIEIGEQIEQGNESKVFRIKNFIEKPDQKTANKFFDKWGYLWNSGISVWKAGRFLELFNEYLPEHAKKINKVVESFDTEKESSTMEKELKGIDPVPVDYAIYEKAQNLAVIPADLGWSDVGTWGILQEILPNNQGTNVVKGKYIGVDTERCLVYSGERLITTLGVSDLIIVDTDDVVFIAHKDKSQEVKELIKKLKEEGKHEYL